MSFEQFEQLRGESSGVKYLAPVSLPTPLPEPCYFQDMTEHTWHLDFLRTFPGMHDLAFEAYTSQVLYAAGRTMWGGVLEHWPLNIHPVSGKTGVFAFSTYSMPGDPAPYTIEEWGELHSRLLACVPFAADRLALVTTTPEQARLTDRSGDVLAAMGLAVLAPDAEVVEDAVEVYSDGEAYGTLRLLGEGQDSSGFGPTDILVVARAPHDIGVVGGVISALPQNVHGHLNLRLSERGAPNAMVGGALEDDGFVSRRDSLVRLRAADGQVWLDDATVEAATAFWSDTQPPLGPAPFDLDADQASSFADMKASDAIRYGAKAANLGELYDVLPDRNRTPGFGLPFAWYAAAVSAPTVAPLIEEVTSDPRMLEDAELRRQRLKALRNAIRSLTLSPAQLQAIRAMAHAELGPEAETTRWRFRSSTNAEDLAEFSGAGLYTSKSGCLADDFDDDMVGPSHCLSAEERAHKVEALAAARAELEVHPERVWLEEIIDDIEDDLTEERTVARALKRVWASLWTTTAFEHRAYYGIPQSSVFMGVAVNPTFILERCDAVAVAGPPTNDVVRLVSQAGEIGVAEPDIPTAVAEVTTWQFGANGEPVGVNVQALSSEGGGSPLWTDAQLAELSSLLWLIRGHFSSTVYADVVELAVDVEVKLTAEGRIAIKQVRPYLGAL